MPRISFILPIYKVEAYLPRAFESLRAQTVDDWEAILVDDGSPDGCGALCDRAAAEDVRFKVIHQKNGGIGAARNAGLDAASGEYVHFFDPDDRIAPDLAEKTLRAAEAHDADVIFFAYEESYYDANGEPAGSRRIEPPMEGVFADSPFKTHFDKLTTLYYAWSKVVRRSVIEQHHVRFTKQKLVEDGIFYAQYFRYNPHCVVLLRDTLYYYTLGRDGSAIRSFHPERAEENFYLSETIESVLRDWDLYDSPMHRDTLAYCYVRDLQLSIKNISLSPWPLAQRIRWLRQIMRSEKARDAVHRTPLARIGSRNDRVKLLLLKSKQYAALMLLSGLWNT